MPANLQRLTSPFSADILSGGGTYFRANLLFNGKQAAKVEGHAGGIEWAWTHEEAQAAFSRLAEEKLDQEAESNPDWFEELPRAAKIAATSITLFQIIAGWREA